jgi:hypothetical protein
MNRVQFPRSRRRTLRQLLAGVVFGAALFAMGATYGRDLFDHRDGSGKIREAMRILISTENSTVAREQAMLVLWNEAFEFRGLLAKIAEADPDETIRGYAKVYLKQWSE